MHRCLTVMVEPEYCGSVQSMKSRAEYHMDEYCVYTTVEGYTQPCLCTTNENIRALIEAGDTECHTCQGTGVETIETNPYARWDWLTHADEDSFRFRDIEPGDPTAALLAPDEGWLEMPRGAVIDDAWKFVFLIIYALNVARGYEPVLVDFHR